MRKIALLFLIGFVNLSLHAQNDTMYVKQTVGGITKYAIANIDSIYFRMADNDGTPYILPNIGNEGVALPYTVLGST